ncbi:MAG: gamma-glutamyltransferase, partial [Caldilineaceae bacterium]|nr:gamma-glutamyltransferase [Caldilineaceae bacterium]
MSTIQSKLLINKTEVVAEQGLVTAMHPLAAAAGAEILQQGGNAADAAVAAAFAVGVVEPFMSGLGGAAYVVAHDAATGRTLTLDGAVQLPQAATPDLFELLDPNTQGLGVYGWRATKDNAAETGYRSIAVPGAVATYATLLERLGTMSLADVLVPAIRLAEEGFPVDWYVFANAAISMSRLQAFPHTMATFFKPDGTPHKPSMIDDVLGPDRFKQLELAQTLRTIAAQGPEVFYRGEIGQLIAQHLREHGGVVTTDDLANYQVREREPLWIDYRGKRVAFISRNSGGTTVAEMLNILGGFDLAGLGHNSAAALHLIAEAQRMAYTDRFAYLGDP